MRQDYCPIGGAPCQSMCDEPCLSTAKKRIVELELALQKQAKAALQGMDSAKSNAAEMLKSANEIQSRLNPELIESERQANAVLTEENEKLIEVVRQRSHKIAELEKDCEILQTNLDAALMQVKQLREALHHIGLPKSKIVYCRDGHEEAVLTARKVLEETK